LNVIRVYVTTDYKVISEGIKIDIELVSGYIMFRTVNGCYGNRYIVDYYGYCARLYIVGLEFLEWMRCERGPKIDSGSYMSSLVRMVGMMQTKAWYIEKVTISEMDLGY